ncbi:MAG: hypothetical protein HY901_28325, partial [Deltaproteobacteria bacterium]|nr:hypothetical protein [Deltaproteobacteria bacterium]
VQAKDAFGNPASESPRAKAELGKTELRPLAPGEWTLEYRAPLRLERGADTVVVELGALSAKSRVALTPNLAGVEVAPRFGVLGTGSLAAPYLSAEAGYHFELRGQPVVVLAEVSWYAFSRVETLGSGEVLQGRHDFLTEMAAVAWRRPFGKSHQWVFQAALGVGLSEALSSLRVDDQPETSQRGIGFVYEVAFGVQRKLWRGGPFLELRYRHHGNLGISNLKGQLGALLVDVGYRYEAL